jgi:N-hydroxyarylamine O-acetyltransferase
VTPAFDLSAYLSRIGFEKRPSADLTSLFALHDAHVEAIPFENADIQMGSAISLSSAALQAKLVSRRRGGYCFEQNGLFALALRAIGFSPLPCEARVRQGTGGRMLPRTHMVLVVPCDGREWLADVGFGGDGLVEPVAMSGERSTQLGYAYRILPEGSLRVLQRSFGEGWEDLYAVLPDPVHHVDFELGNWYTSTYPQSPFVQNLTAQRISGGARHILRNLTYTVQRDGTLETHTITRSELVPLLRKVFGIDLPPDARFRALDA